MDPLVSIEHLCEVGRFREALSAVQQLPLETRRSPAVWAIEAELLVETGDLLGGVALAQRASGSNQANARARANALRVLGQATSHLGELQQSRKHLDHAIELANTLAPKDR